MCLLHIRIDYRSMCSKILVGVTQRVDSITYHNELRDALDQRLIAWLVNVDCIPVPIPNTLIDLNSPIDSVSQPMLVSWLQAVNIKALVFSGGNDIGESSQRDLTENFLFSWAKMYRLTVLGICRGMQMMGVWGGGQLIKTSGHVRTRHQLEPIPDSGE